MFYPFEKDSPFSHCMGCNKYLLEQDVEYVIEKAIRQYPEFGTTDIIFEYAICTECADKMKNALSKESLQSVQAYMMNKSRLFEQSQRLQASNNLNPNDWISQCIFTGQRIEEQTEFQIFAHCKGNQMFFSAMPYMISSQAMDEMAELLSPKTQDELNRFIDDNFGIPPELKQLFKDNSVMLL
ncbi:hypothetical protein [Catalinimonas niigatensis]|uniref:hypothetical protein n=1 Tax=Catalinimonas niigatensis TaxID=1397264 RepID=UPI002666B0FD|nr:hypothetical protein [Catalinimonas niigatensis]WPP50795.1 hypothetical protein PZB72_00105 [Catalinimonas niigatensis]